MRTLCEVESEPLIAALPRAGSDSSDDSDVQTVVGENKKYAEATQ